MAQIQYVGIDVSARNLEVRIQRRTNDPVEALSFSNDARGHQQNTITSNEIGFIAELRIAKKSSTDSMLSCSVYEWILIE